MGSNAPVDGVDYHLFTDGSGHVDGYGGWACLLEDTDRRPLAFRMGCVIGSTVDRMEMTAILEGLQLVTEHRGPLASPHSKVRIRRAVVVLTSDRENLVKSIMGEYGRENSPDLWARFSCYEQQLTIRAQHVGRNARIAQMDMVDLHASSGRIIAVNYHTGLELPEHRAL